jgi:hypothetical protein
MTSHHATCDVLVYSWFVVCKVLDEIAELNQTTWEIKYWLLTLCKLIHNPVYELSIKWLANWNKFREHYNSIIYSSLLINESLTLKWKYYLVAVLLSCPFSFVRTTGALYYWTYSVHFNIIAVSATHGTPLFLLATSLTTFVKKIKTQQ